MARLSKKALKVLLKEDYTRLYEPMTDEMKKLLPVLTTGISNEICGIHFTIDHSGKMAGLQSVSTTCKHKLSICINRIEKAFQLVIKDFNLKDSTAENIKKARALLKKYIEKNPFSTNVSICGFCFSDSQQDYQKDMTPTLERNFDILNNGLVNSDWWPTLNCRFFRGESFGDFASVNAVLNIVTFANKNPETTFAVWTKNPAFFYMAFKRVKKPDNMIIILSSQYITKKTEIDQRFAWFIDKTFTVYTKAYAKENGININCGARACLSCLNCYRKSGPSEISELLK